MKALRQYYSLNEWVKVFRKMLIDTVVGIGSQPPSKDLTPVQKEGYLYLEKATAELAEELKKHGKTKKRI